MLRKIIFWIHLTLGVSAGVFIFVMAATGIMLAFERQITGFVDRDIRSVSEPNPTQQRPIADLLEAVRKVGLWPANGDDGPKRVRSSNQAFHRAREEHLC